MASFYHFLLPLLSLFLVRVDLTDLFPLTIPVKLRMLSDGDTLALSHGSWNFNVRLLHVDAPEKEQLFFRSKLSAGKASLECLEAVMQKERDLLLDVHGFDFYGRVLGDVNGLSLKLVSFGCVALYPHARFESKQEKFRYLMAFKAAQTSRRGLWRMGSYVLPKKWRKLSKRNGRRR